MASCIGLLNAAGLQGFRILYATLTDSSITYLEYGALDVVQAARGCFLWPWMVVVAPQA